MEWIAEITGGTWFWTAVWFSIMIILIKAEFENEDRAVDGFAAFIALIFFTPFAILMTGFAFSKISVTNRIIGQHSWTAVSIYVTGFLSYLGLKWTLPRFILIAENRIRSGHQKFTQWTNERSKRNARLDKTILKKARLYADELFAVLPKDGSADEERRLIKQVLNETLPGLLERHTLLSGDIAATEKDLHRQEALPETDRKRVEGNLDRFKIMLNVVEMDIDAILRFLDTVESDVRMAQREVEKRPGVQQLFEDLIVRYRQGIEDKQKAERDTDRLLGAKLELRNRS